MAKKPPRKNTSPEIETAVLANSARRCALCFHLKGDLTEKLGQIAHLDSDRSNGREDNLAWMCLEHHSLFDSTTSQHKNYTIPEVKDARARLYDLVAAGKHLTPAAALPYLQAEADKRIFHDFLEILPSNGTIRFLREHDFAGRYRPERLDDIVHFTRDRYGPDHEFLDAELEAARKQVWQTCEKFMIVLAGKVFADGQLEGVPAEWEYMQPERYENAVQALNDEAGKVCKTYDDFVRFARRKLAV